jgi:hypothetical protein
MSYRDPVGLLVWVIIILVLLVIVIKVLVPLLAGL